MYKKYRNFVIWDLANFAVHPVNNSLKLSHACARFEVLVAVKIQVGVFWIVTQCSVVVGY
jgi:hypothetical protein